ncbi:asparagine synthase (glutamine-hydrolyzing) [Actinosynnema sp. CS-041913]|uniref:asparagine synthase (glutamine-hydrolyzing) n=1 Tax=Actinosynnema sp. CS-041913 TaxID=3239917 RepID=UPI003D8B6223
MCGIVGWLDFGRDLVGEAPVVRAMTDTMACRGPDDEGTWADTHIALGHRRLAVIDLAGGRQPMAADEDGRTLAVLSYSGEIYNFRELRAELESRGHRFRTRSDTEVVLRSYLEWGEDVVHRLNGMYAFALWDAVRGELLLVRDRLGIKPLYYYPLPDGVLFGSEPKAILANPLAEGVVDADGLRELMAMVKTPGHAVLRGMTELRPGHLLRIGRDGLSTRRYWALEAREHTDDLDTTVRTVRELLDDIVTRQLVSDVPLCALLSGGLDSSAITALAARSQPIRSFTVDFAGYAENFQPNLVAGTTDLPFAHDLAAHAGTDHTDIVLDIAELAAPDARTAVQRARDIPNEAGDFDTSLYLLFQAIREHSTVALSGEGSDEVFGGYKWSFDPAAVAADTFPWLTFLSQADAVSRLFDPELVAHLDLPSYRAQRYREALAEVPRLAGETGSQRRMREIDHLHLTRHLQTLLDRKDRLSMAVGLEVRVPFCDHRLVEYVFNVPWSMKVFDGHEKSLLRAAVRDVLPRSIAERRKSIYPSTLDPAYEQAVRDELRSVLDQGDAPVRPLLDVAATRRWLDTPIGTMSNPWFRMSLEAAIQLNAWLTRYDLKPAL